MKTDNKYDFDSDGARDGLIHADAAGMQVTELIQLQKEKRISAFIRRSACGSVPSADASSRWEQNAAATVWESSEQVSTLMISSISGTTPFEDPFCSWVLSSDIPAAVILALFNSNSICSALLLLSPLA